MNDSEKVKLKLFNAVLFHAGNLLHEVPLVRIDERELRLLRDIHGSGNIERVLEAGEKEVDSRDNYFRLLDKYGGRDDMVRTDLMRKRIERLFSIQIDNFDDWLTNKIEDSQNKATDRVKEQTKADAEAVENEVERRVAARLAERGIVESSIGE